MHLHVHISQGIIIAMLFLPSLSFLEVILVVAFPFLIDFDFLLSKYAQNRNHRRLITHSLIPYSLLLVFGIFFPICLILGICGVVHILSDVIDWGTALFSPLYREPLGGILPKPPSTIIEIPDYRKRQCWFAKTYHNSRIITGLDIFFGAAAILLIIIINILYIWLIAFYLIFLILHLNFYLKCIKGKLG
ncbi:MAG: hypothetical protein EU536_02880 [Promethearchaeota archaeon]|nr:MAG: hypothetical protein EU536_02880 [Candidatus Lokiarchaeota archaeon]